MVWSLVTAGVSLLAKAAVDFAGKGQQPFFFWFNLVILPKMLIFALDTFI